MQKIHKTLAFRQHKLPDIFAIFLLLAFSILYIHIIYNMTNYGFWRHDDWSYTSSELHEFKHSGRFLAPLMHTLFSGIPNKIAFTAYIVLAFFSFYIFFTRLFHGEKTPRTTIIIFCFASISAPAYADQLGWPTHSLSALLPVFIFSLVNKEKYRLLFMSFATIISFGILQSISFIALIIGCPSISECRNKTPRQIYMQYSIVILTWTAAILISHLFSKFLQKIFFEEIPDYPEWRKANPVQSFADIIINVQNNTSAFIKHMDMTFERIPILLILLTIFYVAASCVLKQEHRKLSLYLSLIMFSTSIIISI